ncbi:chain-length determining protein [Geomonas sp. Red32]|uniref:XrtA system polysaccharide chain length determinant n=1 Tax=Geomonas sp. Red32 TaxID=2912856 RepID=UPI00202CF0C2|nr:XrtA system polysaccharide chain length determinant [Geomonas sp. Red32]MCM0083324.1 chain-length determining protein [Geomonas sp. Red32]
MQSSQIDYQQHLNLIRRHKELFVALALFIMTAFFALSYLLPRKYESSSTVFIEKNVISELVKGLTVIPALEDTISTLTYAITSRALLSRVIDTLGLAQGRRVDRDALIRRLQANTKVKVKDKNLFTISFTDSDPRLARDYVNTLVRLYIEENVSSKRGESYEATTFLSDQIKTFRERLDKAETAVNAYKREKGEVITLDEGKLFQEIALAREKVYDLELKRRQLEGMRQITRKAEDPLQARLILLQKRLDELLVQYTESYPEVIQVRSELQTVKEQLKGKRTRMVVPLDSAELGKINADIAAIRIGEEGLRRYIATNSALLKEIPTAKAGLEKLEMEVQNQKKIYDQLFARQGQSEVSREMEVQDKSTTFRVVDPAIRPIKPVSPNRLKIMLLGIIGAIGGSFALLFLREQLDGSVKDVEFLKELGSPVLAIIPRMTDPALVDRQRRRSRGFFTVAGCYLLLLLLFPALELMELPYMDRLIDHLTAPPPAMRGAMLRR